MSKSIDRSRLIALMGVSASMLAGCSPATDGQWRVCRDTDGRRTADANCSGGSGGAWGHGGGGSGWWYISRNANAPAIGETLSYGARAPLSGSAYAAPAEGITRGGFGGFGGEGEGGGYGAGE